MPRNPKDLSASIKLQIDQASKQQVLNEAAEVGKKVGEAVSPTASSADMDQLEGGLKNIVTVIEQMKQSLSGAASSISNLNAAPLNSVRDSADRAGASISKMAQETKAAAAQADAAAKQIQKAFTFEGFNTRPNPASPFQRGVQDIAQVKESMASLATLVRQIETMRATMSGGSHEYETLGEMAIALRKRIIDLEGSTRVMAAGYEASVTQLLGTNPSLEKLAKTWGDLNAVMREAKGANLTGLVGTLEAQQGRLSQRAQFLTGQPVDLESYREATRLAEELAGSQGRVNAGLRAVQGTANESSRAVSLYTSEMKRLALATEELRSVDAKSPLLSEANARLAQLQAARSAAVIAKPSEQVTAQMEAARRANEALAKSQMEVTAGLNALQGVSNSASREVSLYTTQIKALSLAKEQLVAVDKTASTAELDAGIAQLRAARLAAQARVETERAAAQTKPGTFKIFGESFNPAHVAMWAIQWNLVYGAINAVERGLASVVTNANEFDAEMRHVNTIARMTTDEYARMKSVILSLSTLPDFGFGKPQDVAKGLYYVESAGIKESARALTVLTDASRLAVGTQGDLADSTNAIISLMNIYGRETMTSAKAANLLFATVDAAIPDMKEFAKAQTDLLAAAAQSKLPFEQLGAAYASLTREGFSAQRAATGIRNIILSLTKNPTPLLQDAITRSGFVSGQQMLNVEGLQGTLQKLFEAAHGNTIEFAEMLRNARAIAPALALVSDNGRTMTETFNGMKSKLKDSELAAKACNEQMKQLGSGAAGLAASWRAAIENEYSGLHKFLVMIDRALASVGRNISFGVLRATVSDLAKDPKLKDATYMGAPLKVAPAAFAVLDIMGRGGKLGEQLQGNALTQLKSVADVVRMFGDLPAFKGLSMAEIKQAIRLGRSMYAEVKGGPTDEQVFLTRANMALYSTVSGVYKNKRDAYNKLGIPAEGSEELGLDPLPAYDKGTQEWYNAGVAEAVRVKTEIADAINKAKVQAEKEGRKFADFIPSILAKVDEVIQTAVNMGFGTDSGSVKVGEKSLEDPFAAIKLTDAAGKEYTGFYNFYKGLNAQTSKSVKSSETVDNSYTSFVDSYRRLTTDISESKKQFEEAMNPPVDHATEKWKAYEDTLRRISLENSKLVTSFDAAGKGMQEAVAGYFTAVQQLTEAQRTKKEFEDDLAAQTAIRDNAKAEAARILTEIRAKEAWMSETNPGDNASAARKAEWEKAATPVVRQLKSLYDALKIQMDAAEKADKAIASTKDRLRDLDNQIVQLTQDRQQLSRYLYDLGEQADQYVSSPLRRAQKEIENLQQAEEQMFVQLTKNGFVQAANDMRAYTTVIAEGKRYTAELAETTRRLGLAVAEAATKAAPSWRDLMSGAGSISQIFAVNDAQRGIIGGQMFDTNRRLNLARKGGGRDVVSSLLMYGGTVPEWLKAGASEAELEQQLSDFKAKLNSLNESDVDRALTGLSEVARRNYPLAKQLYAQLLSRAGGFSEATQKKLLDWAQNNLSYEAEFAEVMRRDAQAEMTDPNNLDAALATLSHILAADGQAPSYDLAFLDTVRARKGEQIKKIVGMIGNRTSAEGGSTDAKGRKFLEALTNHPDVVTALQAGYGAAEVWNALVGMMGNPTEAAALLSKVEVPFAAALQNAGKNAGGIGADYLGYAERIGQLDLANTLDRNAVWDRLFFDREYAEFLSRQKGGLFSSAYGQAVRTQYQTAGSALSLSAEYMKSRSAYMSRQDAANLFMADMMRLDEIGQSRELQEQAAKALVDLFGSKDLAKDFLTKLGRNNPASKAVADVIIQGLESPDIPDELGKMVNNLRDDMVQQFTDGFMSIIEQGKSFEEAMSNIFRQIALDLERQLISKMVASGINWLFGGWEMGWPGVSPTPTDNFGTQKMGGYTPFAAGGVVTARPGGVRSILAEAGMNEAVVPLPGGRHIPVQLMGGASKPQQVQATTVVVFDKQQLAALRTGKDEIQNVVLVDLMHNGPIRQTIKRTFR